MRPALLALFFPALLSAALTADLDPTECYRVREISLAKDEARFYFTDGYLIFAKDSGGKRIAAVFSADVEGGDAEVLLLPPNRAERRSLASYSGSPNLDEHFTAAVMLFTDGSERELTEQIQSISAKKSPEMGILLAEKWSPVARNIASSFETRLQLDLLSTNPEGHGFFSAAIVGRQLGNFDLIFDRRAPEQLFAGQLSTRKNEVAFEIWTSFTSRSFQSKGLTPSFTPEYSVKEYRIDATLDPDLRLRCTTRIRLKLSGGAERVLPFDISSRMKVTAVQVDGQPAELIQRDSVRSNLMHNTGNELFLVVSNKPLDAAVEHEIEVRHEGAIVTDAGHHVYFVGSRGSWYPGRGLQFSHYDLTFRYPKELDLVAAGAILEDKVEGAQRITRRKTDTPVRMAGFNLGNFERTTFTHGDFSVEVCANRNVERALQPKLRDPVVMPPATALGWPRQPRHRLDTVEIPEPPANPVNRLQTLASEIDGAMEFYAARFGPPPLRSIEVSPIPGRFGQGFAGMIYLSTLSYLDSSNKVLAALPERERVFFSELLHAHEAAHQWWGNVIASAGYHDDWMMEALANYSALLYIEKRKGLKIAEAILAEYKRDLLAKSDSGETTESAGPVVQGARLESLQNPNAWTAIVYGKGTWILHMLRRRMGDDQFFPMMAELRKRYEWKTLSTEQFRAICAEFLPPKSLDPKLENFFDQWVYGTGIPSLKLNYSVKGRAPSWRVTGTVAQTGVDEDFSVLVPVEIQAGRGKTVTQWVRTGPEPASFSIGVRGAPGKLVLDPGGSILRR
ncbi:MAG: hypothetical protein M3Z23_02415 [Acidobacteriota bacterium]|nr:hypothetical protein [Acidobacteriota bacterium]